MTKAEVARVQEALNAFTDKRLRGVAPLIVDGDKGPATNTRIRMVKHYLGFKHPIGSAAGKQMIPRLRSPKKAELFPDDSYVRRGVGRRVRQRARYRQQLLASVVAPGVTRYDGVPCAVWLVPYLQYARRNGWKGRLVSGWRSPAYSESLCYRMCNQPRCPGLCAGRASNHSGSSNPRGALDVSDYTRFGELMKDAKAPRHPRIFNDLPNDRVHFSATGG